MKQRQRVPSGTDVHWSVSKWNIDINLLACLHMPSEFERAYTRHKAILWLRMGNR
jgi:hypothetical protein